MERYVHKRRQDGIYVINLEKTWEKLQVRARKQQHNLKGGCAGYSCSSFDRTTPATVLSAAGTGPQQQQQREPGNPQ